MINIEDFYQTLLTERGFSKISSNGKFNETGQTWELSKELGEGYYWVYVHKNLFNIKIHDFKFHQDFIMDYFIPQCLNIAYYESISGDELTPYRRMNANCVKTYIGGRSAFKAIIHKKVPIKSIDIEIMPDYYIDYLKSRYPKDYINPLDSFLAIDETTDFPEMILLLNQIKNYYGNGISAKLFYESKVAEAVSLIVARTQETSNQTFKHISANDKQQIHTVTAYIQDHYSYELPLEQLCKIACMGTTKLKQSFKIANGCTITEFIQSRRMGQAEYLLSHTDLTIAQISKTVGYANPSRFAELFRKSLGILPGEYRKVMNINN